MYVYGLASIHIKYPPTACFVQNGVTYTFELNVATSSTLPACNDIGSKRRRTRRNRVHVVLIAPRKRRSEIFIIVIKS